MFCKIKGLPQILLHVASDADDPWLWHVFRASYSTNCSIGLLLSYVASQPMQICSLT